MIRQCKTIKIQYCLLIMAEVNGSLVLIAVKAIGQAKMEKVKQS